MLAHNIRSTTAAVHKHFDTIPQKYEGRKHFLYNSLWLESVGVTCNTGKKKPYFMEKIHTIIYVPHFTYPYLKMD